MNFPSAQKTGQDTTDGTLEVKAEEVTRAQWDLFKLAVLGADVCKEPERSVPEDKLHLCPDLPQRKEGSHPAAASFLNTHSPFPWTFHHHLHMQAVSCMVLGT